MDFLCYDSVVPKDKIVSPPTLTISRKAGYFGILSFENPATGQIADVELEPRYVKFILLLVATWNIDKGKRDSWRGYGNAGILGATFMALPEAEGPVSADAIKHYMCDIRRAMVKAVGDGEIPPIFESHKKFGYRLGESGMTVQWEDVGVVIRAEGGER